jgi:hypothetical protein
MDNKKVTMTIKEIKRVEVMTWVDIGKITPACDYSHKEVQTKRKDRTDMNKQTSISNYSPGKDHPWKHNYGYRLNGKLIH